MTVVTVIRLEKKKTIRYDILYICVLVIDCLADSSFLPRYILTCLCIYSLVSPIHRIGL